MIQRSHFIPVGALPFMRAIHLSVDHNCTLYSYNNNTFTLWNQDRDTTVAQKGHVYYQFQHFQLPILNFLISNFQYGYFSLPLLNFLVSDF